MTAIEAATRLLTAMATSDVATVREHSRPDLLIYGTDKGERWDRLEPFLAALETMRELELSAAWSEPPTAGHGWVAGVARYTGPGLEPLPVRVSMAFDGERLAHAHFSVEVRA